MTNKKIVIPGEVLAEGNEWLPGEGTEKTGDKIISIKYGLAEENKRLVKVIPLSGTYRPRKGNIVIGEVENITFNGWIIDLGIPERSFLSLTEVPRYVNKNDLEDVMDIKDIVIGKISNAHKNSIDLTIKSRNLGKIEEGLILKVNPNKVPRIIGKEGSMINLIKKETGCDITVGRNGLIWVKGKTVEDELKAKGAILFVAEKSFISGLTDEVKNWFEGK